MRWLYPAVAGSLAWVAFVEGYHPRSYLFGALIGVVLAALLRSGDGSGRPLSLVARFGTIARLIFRFSLEILVANAQQLRIVLAPKISTTPHWLDFHTELRSPSLRAVLSLLISLTPGSVTAELYQGHLTIHLLNADDPEAVAEGIRKRFEEPLLELER